LFEQGYEKLCIKCGSVLPVGNEYDPLLDHPLKKPGIIGKLFHSFSFRRKTNRGVTPDSVSTEEIQEHVGVSAYDEPRTESPQEAPELALDEKRSETVFSFVDHGEDPEPIPQVRDSVEGPPPIFMEEETPEESIFVQPLDDSPDSIEDCRRVIALDPDNINAYKRLGHLLFLEGRYEEAVDSLEKAIERDPDDPGIWGELGRVCYRGARDYSKSIACCEKALSLDPKPVWIHCNLCLSLLHEGRFEEAKAGFLKIIRAIQDGKESEDDYQENIRTLLHDCLGDLYNAKKEASGNLLKEVNDIIELLELEKIYFH